MKKRDFLKIIAGLFAVPVIVEIDPSNEKKIYGDGRVISKVINIEPWGECKVSYWKELNSRRIS